MAPEVAFTTMRRRLMLRLFDWFRIALAPFSFACNATEELACIGVIE